jgi:adenylate cyclase
MSSPAGLGIVRVVGEMEYSPTVTRVERTFAFIDLSGFTTFVDVQGDEAAVAALADFRSVTREVASHHGVRVDKWLGDGAMFVSVESAPLVLAVLDIASRLGTGRFPLPIRAGIASGMVILFEGDDYIGMPVNLASRLCSEAPAGQVWVTEPVADHAENASECERINGLDVRGIAEPITVVALCVPSPVTAAPALF